jgi:hypothetical protein
MLKAYRLISYITHLSFHWTIPLKSAADLDHDGYEIICMSESRPRSVIKLSNSDPDPKYVFFTNGNYVA